MSMSVAYAMMNAGDISIRSPENIKCCLELNTARFGTGHVYFRVFAVTSPSRSFRFDQVAETYSDRKVMKHLVEVMGQGEFISHSAPSNGGAGGPEPAPSGETPTLIYVWEGEYNKIVGHNQHHGYNFVVLKCPSFEEYLKIGDITDEDIKEFYGG